uniref:hypothetical protein n=1 Tax=uncultured Acinetobacter sp. TaxID=165433 RepID=UPI0026276A6B|nr:hypothetical protein [uncultured Acinetobacter sp.]
MMQQQPTGITPVLAFCLSFLFSVTLAPTLGLIAYQQYDFLVLWLVTMLVLALPALYMEVGLAKRAKSAPLQGLMQLTRDADVSTKWRTVSWLAVVIVPLFAGAMIHYANSAVMSQLTLQSNTMGLNPSIAILVLAIVAVALSMLPRLILLAVSSLAVIAFIVLGMLAQQGTWQWTGVSFAEWAKVVTLTLVTGGLGLGVYWQSATQNIQANNAEKASITPVVLAIWVAQAIGLLAMLWANQSATMTQSIVLLVGALSLSAYLLQLIRAQLIQRQIALPIQALILLIPILIWALPISNVLYPILIALGLVLCLAYAIFAGWLMKISHLRKSLNFKNEMSYNLWRILIRIVVPVSIVVAMIAWFQILLTA